MVIFMGIQASGKSTFYKQMMAEHGYAHINLDTLRTRNNEAITINKCLENEESFVVDNTNPQKSDRQRYIILAKEHGYEIIGIFFQSIVRDCIARNEKREVKVPRKAIPCTSNNLQMPDYSEGFDKLYFTRITEEGFEIAKWKVK